MKNKIGYIIALFLCLAACRQEPGYKVTVTVAGMPDGLKVYLEDRNSRALDSTVTENESFVFEGKVETPFYADFDIKTPGDRFVGRVFSLFLENSDIRVESNWEEDFFDMKITGSALQDEYAAYEKRLEPLYRKLHNELYEKYWNAYSRYLYENCFEAGHIPAGMEIARLQNQVTEQVQKVMMEFVGTHSASPVALKVLDNLLGYASSFTADEIDGWTKPLSPELKRTEAYRALEEKIAVYKETAKGEKFIDFRVVDVNGKEGMLSDYVQPGKYNLLEVWASWCGHCRVEVPHLKILRKKYGDRFNIIAVSTDKTDEEWRKAMNADKPNYLQLRAVKDDKGKDVGDYYRLRGIPYSLVIDGEGRIVSENGRGAKLDVLLEEQYGK